MRCGLYLWFVFATVVGCESIAEPVDLENLQMMRDRDRQEQLFGNAEIRAVSDGQTKGQVDLRRSEAGDLVAHVRLEGLRPNSEHEIRIQSQGNCLDPGVAESWGVFGTAHAGADGRVDLVITKPQTPPFTDWGIVFDKPLIIGNVGCGTITPPGGALAH